MPAVRKIAANALIDHANHVGNLPQLMALFDNDKTRAVRWSMDYLARQLKLKTDNPPD
jgi:hypothetical protein